jgi:hypothetical protein
MSSDGSGQTRPIVCDRATYVTWSGAGEQVVAAEPASALLRVAGNRGPGAAEGEALSSVPHRS